MIKDLIKKTYYALKYRSKNVVLCKKVRIGGFNTIFEGNNKIFTNTFFTGRLGFGSYIGENCNINAKIGKYCSVAGNVTTVGGKHPTKDFISTHPAFFSTRKQAGFTYISEDKFCEKEYAEGNYSVIIGNDVWIGFGAMLMEGIKIGDGAVIAAGAVVTKDVKPYSIVGGVPAKEIRKRFSDEEIEFLKEFKWWDKPEDWIKENAEKFDDINKIKR